MQLFWVLTSLISIAYLALFLLYASKLKLISKKLHKSDISTKTIENIPLPTISVVIACRNEAPNLPILLESLENLNYPTSLCEIIIVDDHSTDASYKILQTAAQKNAHLKVLQLADFYDKINTLAFKKTALEIGISKASGEIIACTDADCMVPANWLLHIGSTYREQNWKFAVMPVQLLSNKSLLQNFQQIDFMMLQAITATKIHTLCNGANLAFTKQGFQEVDGYTNINQIASGDDMLLLQKFKTRFPKQIAYLFDKENIVATKPASTLSAFLQQRIRWGSKSKHYTDKTLLPALVIVYFLNLLLFVSPVLLLFPNVKLNIWMPYFVSIFAAKILAELLILIPAARFFSIKLGWYLFFQPFHIAYIVSTGLLANFGTYKWKSRTVK